MSRIHKLENIYQEQLKNHKIDDISNFIQSILNADITKGKYARFLLDAFLNDKFLEEDLIGELESTVGQAISLFHKHKSKLPENMRSVFKYSSPGDLWNSVKQFQGELSGKELKKEEQEKVYRETEFIYKDEETGFQIISPLTKKSAQWWGRGTRWCTSAENNNMFWNYAEFGPLLILLIPNNSGNTTGNSEKLQLWKYKNDIQFMDEADNSVSREYIEQHWDILEPICKWLNDLKFIPDEYKTKELCDLAVQQNGLALQYVPKHLRTPYLYEIAVKQDGMALEYVPKEFKTLELCKIAVKNNGSALGYTPEELKTEELCAIAVKQNGKSLEHVKKNFKTSKLCELAVKQNGLNLMYVPYISKELCEIAVKQNGCAVYYIPENIITEELCELAVKQNSKALKYIPYELRTKKLYELAVKQNGWSLGYTPDKYKTEELCLEAVQQNGWILQYVPEELRTKELCEIAIKNNGKALKFIPDNLKNKLKHYAKDEIFELPMEKYQEIFQEIKTLFPEKNISLDYHYL